MKRLAQRNKIKLIKILFSLEDRIQFSVKFYSVKSKKFLCKISNQTQEESDRILNSFIPSGAKTQKKEKMTYPRCGFGACLKCGQAF